VHAAFVTTALATASVALVSKALAEVRGGSGVGPVVGPEVGPAKNKSGFLGGALRCLACSESPSQK
jgi:hypothetical protein